MKKLLEWDYNTGQIKLNYNYLISSITSKMLNIKNIWNDIDKRRVKISTKEEFNKTKTMLNYAEITIKSLSTNSHIKISIKDKAEGIKLKFVELAITKEEKNFFLNHTPECLLLLYHLIHEYYSKKIKPVKEKGLKKFEIETEKLKKMLES